MSNILKFPKKHRWEPTGYRINLYTEEDIYIVLLCLNISDDLDDPKKWVRQDLRTLEPEFVIDKMSDCLDNQIISDPCKKQIRRIIQSAEVLPLSALRGETM
jgi:hypothetical protein|tara:strand:+ start:6114 stop:6419 length:306 start_codon:yes stop_codon:yes gene_type:complete